MFSQFPDLTDEQEAAWTAEHAAWCASHGCQQTPDGLLSFIAAKTQSTSSPT